MCVPGRTLLIGGEVNGVWWEPAVRSRGSCSLCRVRPTRDVKNGARDAGLLLGYFAVTLEWGQSFLLMSPKPGPGRRGR